MAYVLTRPLGGSTGDYLSGDKSAGGAGLGTLVTSLVFLTAIVAIVMYLSITKKDQTEVLLGSDDPDAAPAQEPEFGRLPY